MGRARRVKVFFADHDLDIPSRDLRKLFRNVLPNRARASTPDKIPTKAQLRSILNYMDIKGRAIILFLASTGCRIGETLRLKKIDLKLRARERIYQELLDRQW